ncbi:MAG: class I SAM-dependent methyltransferase [Planctomycetaceae bacterium]
MSTPQPASRNQEPQHDPEEATRWFNQWHVYRAIVDANWMAHREIFSAIRACVLMRYPGPFTLLDLGCGDAGFIKSTFDETGLWSYTGVDASQAALAKARDELAGARFQAELLEADMLAYLRADSGSAAETFDVILASYAVHHLPAQEKQEFFRLAHAKLAPRGSLLYADVCRRDSETREQYLTAYVDMMRRVWAGMPPESLASTTQHVMQRDFPETDDAISAMAREAGFCEEPRELFRDATGFHRLIVFTKEAGA